MTIPACGRFSRYAVLLTVLLAGARPAVAHHSFSMFDTAAAKIVTLTGTVSKFEWTNPHAYIHLDVPDPNGKVKNWLVELGSTSILQEGGWKYKDLKAGDKVTARLSPLRDGTPGGLLVQVTLADGRVLGNGPGRGPATPAPAAAK